MARKPAGTRRQRGHIRRRGGSFQVLVYAGTDPLTAKPHYLTESTGTEAQAQRALTRLLAQVDEQRSARTKAALGAALYVPAAAGLGSNSPFRSGYCGGNQSEA